MRLNRRILASCTAVVTGVIAAWTALGTTVSPRSAPVADPAPAEPRGPDPLRGTSPSRPSPTPPANSAVTNSRMTSVRVTVHAAAMRVPIESAKILVLANDARPSTPLATGSTADDGVVTVGPFDVRNAAVLVLAAGYRPWSTQIPVPRDSDEGPIFIEASLDAGCELHARVVDDSGAGIRGALVRAVRPENSAAWPVATGLYSSSAFADGAEATSTVDGVVALRGLAPETQYLLVATASDYADGEFLDPPRVACGDPPRVLVLRRTTTVDVRVEDSNGEPLAQSVCTATIRLPAWLVRVPAAPARTLAQTEAEPTKRFRFVTDTIAARGVDPTRPVQIRVRVSCLGLPEVQESIEISPGATNLVTIRLPAQTPATRRVVFRCSLADGTPLNGSFLMGARCNHDGRIDHLTVRFSGGVSVESWPLPVGRHTWSVLAGASPSTEFYSPRTPVAFNFDVGEELETPQTVRWSLPGRRLTLETETPSGGAPWSFDLRVTGEALAVEPPWSRGWSGRSLVSGDSTGVFATIVPVGPIRVEVNAVGVGRGSKDIADGMPTGSDGPIRIRITEPEIDYAVEKRAAIDALRPSGGR